MLLWTCVHNIWVLAFNFLGHKSRRGISGLCSNCLFNFLRNCHADFQYGEKKKGSDFPRLVAFIILKITDTLMSVRCYTVPLISLLLIQLNVLVWLLALQTLCKVSISVFVHSAYKLSLFLIEIYLRILQCMHDEWLIC